MSGQKFGEWLYKGQVFDIQRPAGCKSESRFDPILKQIQQIIPVIDGRFDIAVDFQSHQFQLFSSHYKKYFDIMSADEPIKSGSAIKVTVRPQAVLQSQPQVITPVQVVLQPPPHSHHGLVRPSPSSPTPPTPAPHLRDPRSNRQMANDKLHLMASGLPVYPPRRIPHYPLLNNKNNNNNNKRQTSDSRSSSTSSSDPRLKDYKQNISMAKPCFRQNNTNNNKDRLTPSPPPPSSSTKNVPQTTGAVTISGGSSSEHLLISELNNEIREKYSLFLDVIKDYSSNNCDLIVDFEWLHVIHQRMTSKGFKNYDPCVWEKCYKLYVDKYIDSLHKYQTVAEAKSQFVYFSEFNTLYFNQRNSRYRKLMAGRHLFVKNFERKWSQEIMANTLPPIEADDLETLKKTISSQQKQEKYRKDYNELQMKVENNVLAIKTFNLIAQAIAALKSHYKEPGLYVKVSNLLADSCVYRSADDCEQLLKAWIIFYDKHLDSYKKALKHYYRVTEYLFEFLNIITTIRLDAVFYSNVKITKILESIDRRSLKGCKVQRRLRLNEKNFDTIVGSVQKVQQLNSYKQDDDCLIIDEIIKPSDKSTTGASATASTTSSDSQKSSKTADKSSTKGSNNSVDDIEKGEQKYSKKSTTTSSDQKSSDHRKSPTNSSDHQKSPPIHKFVNSFRIVDKRFAKKFKPSLHQSSTITNVFQSTLCPTTPLPPSSSASSSSTTLSSTSASSSSASAAADDRTVLSTPSLSDSLNEPLITCESDVKKYESMMRVILQLSQSYCDLISTYEWCTVVHNRMLTQGFNSQSIDWWESAYHRFTELYLKTLINCRDFESAKIQFPLFLAYNQIIFTTNNARYKLLTKAREKFVRCLGRVKSADEHQLVQTIDNQIHSDNTNLKLNSLQLELVGRIDELKCLNLMVQVIKALQKHCRMDTNTGLYRKVAEVMSLTGFRVKHGQQLVEQWRPYQCEDVLRYWTIFCAQNIGAYDMAVDCKARIVKYCLEFVNIIPSLITTEPNVTNSYLFSIDRPDESRLTDALVVLRTKRPSLTVSYLYINSKISEAIQRYNSSTSGCVMTDSYDQLTESAADIDYRSPAKNTTNKRSLVSDYDSPNKQYKRHHLNLDYY
ncbi:uncharacterized protein LOC128963106 isoform X2 [Oppia nitens]|uniref:uncharacterized protein LOC128963106 isoform X2 n=1 Tax=Oppia nitens TaxID=1686743 RepID=UPI0023DCE79D|nr:uncharacterized protein LOC128963106 isoform X2 [Oppia nitens]